MFRSRHYREKEHVPRHGLVPTSQNRPDDGSRVGTRRIHNLHRSTLGCCVVVAAAALLLRDEARFVAVDVVLVVFDAKDDDGRCFLTF